MASSKDKAKGIGAKSFFDPDIQDYAVNVCLHGSLTSGLLPVG